MEMLKAVGQQPLEKSLNSLMYTWRKENVFLQLTGNNSVFIVMMSTDFKFAFWLNLISIKLGRSSMENTDKVLFYEGKYYMYSNFSSFAVEWRGILMMTSEHQYQASKFSHE